MAELVRYQAGRQRRLVQDRRGHLAERVHADLVTVDMLSGQAPAQFEASTSQLAHTFSALRCRVVVDRPGRIVLEFTHGDPLTETVAAFSRSYVDNGASP